MYSVVATPRTALLAGATGLVGRALLSLLLASTHYRSVHVLLRRTPPDIKAGAKLKIHQVDFARLPATLAPLGWVMPKSVRPIPARAVASALLVAILDSRPGV